jgi:hypothetical protein
MAVRNATPELGQPSPWKLVKTSDALARGAMTLYRISISNALQPVIFEHLRKHDDDSEEGEDMKHHDATLDEGEVAEEDSVDHDDKGQDGEGN